MVPTFGLKECQAHSIVKSRMLRARKQERDEKYEHLKQEYLIEQQGF